MSIKATLTHTQSRERNERFAEFVQSEEVSEKLKIIPKSKHVAWLREQFEAEYGMAIPPSAAYKVMGSIDERFKPRHKKAPSIVPEQSELEN